MEDVTGVEDVTEPAADRLAAQVMEELCVSILPGHTSGPSSASADPFWDVLKLYIFVTKWTKCSVDSS